jgi:hypothetical protein
LKSGPVAFDEWNRFESTHEFFHCEKCDQWHEKRSTDVPCGPYTVTFEPIDKKIMDNLIAHCESNK